MEKKMVEAFGYKMYLLGADQEGKWYFMLEPKWDCGWYWGGLYVETFTNNKSPDKSRDIESHSHFDSMFFTKLKSKNGFYLFKEFFVETPFTDDEIYKLMELAKSFYIASEYSDMIHRGGSHYTDNPASEVIKNGEEYHRINHVVIPALMSEMDKILKP